MEGLIGRLEPQISKLKNHVDISHLSPKALTALGFGSLALTTACSKADLGPIGGIAAIVGFGITAVAIYIALKS